MDANFIDSIGVLNRLEVDYWLSAGSLLGILRDNCLIPWDHDIDVCVLEENFDLLPLGRALRGVGFCLVYTNGSTFHFARSGGRTLDVSVVRSITIGSDVLYANVWDNDDSNSRRALVRNRFYRALAYRMDSVFREVGRRHVFFQLQIRVAMLLRGVVDAVVRPQQVAYFVPQEFLVQISEKNFHGVTVRVPEAGERVLESIYGNGWRTPVKSKTWQEFTKPV